MADSTPVKTAANGLPGFHRPKWIASETVKRKVFEKRLGSLRNEREYFLDEWRDIADFIHPRRGRFLSAGQDAGKPRRSSLMLNNAGYTASRTLGAGMMSGISSPARPWFKLGTPDPELMEFGKVKIWAKAVQDRMQLVFSKSNFYDSLQMVYRDLGDFGSASMAIDQDYNDVIRCTVFAPGEYYLATSERGNVNTVYREHSRTVMQMIEKHGDRCSQRVIDLYDNGSYEAKIDVVTVIEPNYQQMPDAPGARGAPFIMAEYEKASDDENKILSVNGYKEWAIPSPRWDVQTGEVYGSGCGIAALADTKGLQSLEKEKHKAIAKIVTPPMTAPTSLKNQPASHLPGGVTYIEGVQGSMRFEPAYQIDPRAVQLIGGEIDKHERRIDEAYYKDLFLMLAQSDRREITAREVEERHEEKLLALGPVLERLHNELLNVAIDRTFSIMARANLLPPAPDEIKGVELNVEYISILAQAQRAVAVGGMERIVGFVGNLSAGFPTVVDKIDADQMVDEYAAATGVVPTVIRSDDDVKAIRDQRAGEQQQQAAMEQGAMLAANAEVLSNAQLTEPSVLSQIVGGAGQAAGGVPGP